MANTSKTKALENELKITSVTDLESYAKGVLVQLPDFSECQPFVARVKRPSMIALAKSGKIPNSLLGTASQLFSGQAKASSGKSEKMLSDMYDVCRIICEASLVEPTLADIDAAGLELTDEQMIAIFNYSQTGAKALESFRKEQEHSTRAVAGKLL